MRVRLVYLVVMVMLLRTQHAMCNDEEPDPPAGMERIPPAMTLDDFKSHVVGYLMEEQLWIHGVNSTLKFWFAARILVSEISANVYNIRITGDESLRDGYFICQNTTGIYYGVNKTSAEFMNEAGARYVFYSSEPHRYIWATRCENWEPGSVYCPVNSAYTSVYIHDDDDIEYYEYDNEEKGKSLVHRATKADIQGIRLSKNSVVHRNSKSTRTDKPEGRCQYDDVQTVQD